MSDSVGVLKFTSGLRGNSGKLTLDGNDISPSVKGLTIKSLADSIVEADVYLYPRDLDVETPARCAFYLTVPTGYVLLKETLDSGRERWRCVPEEEAETKH